MPTLNPVKLSRMIELKGVVRKRPGELSAWRELAEICREAGLNAEAISHLQVLVGAYAAQGAVYRAIGICRDILALDPEHHQTKATLASLYAREGSSPSTTITLPPSMSSALLPRRSRVQVGAVGIPDGDPIDVAAVVDEVDDDDIVLDNDVLADVDVDVIDADSIAGLTAKDGEVTLARSEKVPLFSGLSPDVFSILLSQLSAWEAAPGTTIVAEGEVSESVFVIAKGKARVQREVDGEVVVVAELGPHTFFGEIALLVHRPRAASVVAVEATELLEIPKRIIDELILIDPRVAEVIRHFAEDRLKHTTLLTSPLLRALPDATKADIEDMFVVRAFEPGDALVEAGARAPQLGVVLAGIVDVTHDGARISELGVGDIFGEMSLVTQGVAEESVVARTTGRMLALGADDVDEVLFAQPALRERLAAVAKDRAALNARLLGGTARSSEGRRSTNDGRRTSSGPKKAKKTPPDESGGVWSG